MKQHMNQMNETKRQNQTTKLNWTKEMNQKLQTNSQMAFAQLSHQTEKQWGNPSS